MNIVFPFPVVDLVKWVAQRLREMKADPARLEPLYLDMLRCSALIVFVSSSRDNNPLKSAARYAIDYHYYGQDGQSSTNKLKHVWLMYSPKTVNDARELRNYLENRSIGCNLVGLDGNKDIDNAKHIKDKIDEILKSAVRRKIPLEEIAIDITGGTISVSIGMLVTCMAYVGPQMQIMLVDDQDKDADGRPGPGARSRPRKIELRYQN